MPQRRLRIFAGPNGSGKSTLLRYIPETVPLGVYINADDIEIKLFHGGLDFDSYSLIVSIDQLHSHFENSEYVNIKSNINQLKKSFRIENNRLKVTSWDDTPKYAAAIVAEFIREMVLLDNLDFSFETVLSHRSKLDFIRKANENGFHTYMYFICVDDPRVNVERVKTRVIEGGHPVTPDKIVSRYYRSLELLYDSLKLCYKSYLFDNSDKFSEIARVNRDKRIHLMTEVLPTWFSDYVIKKT